MQLKTVEAVHKSSSIFYCVRSVPDFCAHLQVSPGGGYVATIDKHTLFIWSTKDADKRPLALHHTKAFTVSTTAFFKCCLLNAHLPSKAGALPDNDAARYVLDYM